jgi:hypothetical protein
LRRSIRTSIQGETLKTLSGAVFSEKVKYAKIQEKGGTIRAKKAYTGVPGGPYLNIPLSANKTGAGVQRRSAKSVFQSGGFLIRSKRGKFLVMSSTGVPMFVLTKKVKIKPRLGMEAAAEDEIPVLLARLNQSMTGVIQ